MRLLVPSADRDGRADCRFGLTTRARFACQNHRPAREKRPRQATHVCRRRTCFLRRRWALVSPTGRLKFPCLLLPESSILCQHVHAVPSGNPIPPASASEPSGARVSTTSLPSRGWSLPTVFIFFRSPWSSTAPCPYHSPSLSPFLFFSAISLRIPRRVAILFFYF